MGKTKVVPILKKLTIPKKRLKKHILPENTVKVSKERFKVMWRFSAGEDLILHPYFVSTKHIKIQYYSKAGDAPERIIKMSADW